MAAVIAVEDLQALDAINLRLAELDAEYEGLRARMEAHLGRRATVPELRWRHEADQIGAEAHEWRKAIAAVQAAGDPIRDRVRAALAALCADCRAAAGAIVGAAGGGGAEPCPACGR